MNVSCCNLLPWLQLLMTDRMTFFSRPGLWITQTPVNYYCGSCWEQGRAVSLMLHFLRFRPLMNKMLFDILNKIKNNTQPGFYADFQSGLVVCCCRISADFFLRKSCSWWWAQTRFFICRLQSENIKTCLIFCDFTTHTDCIHSEHFNFTLCVLCEKSQDAKKSTKTSNK